MLTIHQLGHIVEHAIFPCLSQGLPISTFPGVYDTTNEEIAKYSEVYWAEHNL